MRAIQKLDAASVVDCDPAPDCLAFTGHFELDGDCSDLLLNLLPHIVHVRGEQEKRTLRWCLKLAAQELRGSLPGHNLIAQQIAMTMLVQVLRGYAFDQATEKCGWLFALRNTQINRPWLQCMTIRPDDGPLLRLRRSLVCPAQNLLSSFAGWLALLPSNT